MTATWRWARISLAGARYLGVYGHDEHGHVFHAVLDLAAISDKAIAFAARAAAYTAFASWRLGPHDAITQDERLPDHILATTRLPYDEAAAEQTIVLVLTTSEVRLYGLPAVQQT